MEKMIELKKISKSFNEEVVIENLDYTFYSNEIVVILGYSGVGKSTLIRLISRLDTDYKGEIEYASEIDFEEKIIPVVFQDFNQLLPWYSVKKNILLPYKINNSKLEVFNQIIKILELEDALDKFPKELSGGMKQRVAIARALLAESKVILFDEPFGSLDITMRQNLQTLILEIQRAYQQIIIFVTHDIDEAVFLADRLLIMENSSKRQELTLSMKNKERYTPSFDQQVRDIIKIMEGPINQ